MLLASATDMTDDGERIIRSAARTRERLVDAAEELMVAAGDESAVSVRALGERAGVTAPTIYRHFPDMSALLAEVASRQFAQLSEAVASAGGDEDPVAEIAAFGRAFTRFGLEHPGSYRVLFMNRASASSGIAEKLRDASGYQRLGAAVRRAMAAGVLPADDDPAEVTSILVMSLHGVVSMLIARPGPWPDAERLVDRMIVTIGYGLLPRV